MGSASTNQYLSLASFRSTDPRGGYAGIARHISHKTNDELAHGDSLRARISPFIKHWEYYGKNLLQISHKGDNNRVIF